MTASQLRDVLQSASIFAVLSDEEFEELAGAFELASYTLGQTVVRAGDASDSFYVVYSGRARVVADKQGEEITLGTLTRGGRFGEQGLMRQTEREFTVRAAGDLVLLRLWKKDFERLLEHLRAQRAKADVRLPVLDI